MTTEPKQPDPTPLANGTAAGQSGLALRVHARTTARGAIELGLDALEPATDETKAQFWDAIRAELPKQNNQPTPVGPMTDAQAINWERTRMPFGEWQAQRVKDTPLDYLVWLADQPFYRELNRYLKSPRMKAEIDRMTTQ